MIESFNFQGHPIRAVKVDGSDWLIANDVASALELTNPRSSLALLEDDEKGVHSVDTPGGPQEMLTVNMPGVYNLVLRSRKPAAKAFRRWLTHEVLPALDDHGTYSLSKEIPPVPSERELVEGWLANLNRAEVAEARIEQLEGPASAWEALAANGGAYTLRKAAHTLWSNETETGQNRLMKSLKKWTWVSADGQPYQAYVNRGLLRQRAKSDQLLITAEGLEAIRQRLLAEQQTELELVSA